MRPLSLAVGIICLTLVAGCKSPGDDPKHTTWAAPTPFALVGAPTWATNSIDSSEVPMTVEGIALGKALFFDQHLSADGKVSCASCHQPRFAFSDPHPVSKGVFGQNGKRSAMAIVNLANVRNFFWDGREPHLHEQVSQPMLRSDEMGMTVPQIEAVLQTGDYPTLFGKAFLGATPSLDNAKIALSMFCRSLISFNSRYDQAEREEIELTAQEKRGKALFFTHPIPEQGIRGANCVDCHKSLTLAGENDLLQHKGFANNGLDYTFTDLGQGAITGKAWQNGRFRIPTLRNIALTAPYMHDGRFQTLEQVVDHYNDPDLFNKPGVDTLLLLGSNQRYYGSLGLTDSEKADLVAFLKTFTDTTYLHR